MSNYKLTHKLWARITAYLLIVAAATVLLLCALGCAAAYDQGWYFGQQAKFESSWLCQERGRQEARYFIDTVFDYGIDNTDMLYESENFSFVVRDNSGKTLFDNTTAASVLSGKDECWYSVDDQQYCVDYYVNYPVPEHSTLWYNSQLLSNLYNGRMLYIWLGAGMLLLCLLLFIFLLCSAGHVDGDDDYHLLRQDKIPLDLHLAICFCIGAAFVALAAEAIDGFSITGGVIGFTVAGLMCNAMVMAFAMTFAARIKVGKWWKNTVIYRIVSRLWRLVKVFCRGIKRFVGLIPMTWRTVLFFGAYLIINAIFAGFLFSDSSAFALFMLLLVNGLLLYVMMQITVQCRELKKAGQALASGELDYVVDTKKMRYDIKEHADDLNSISSGMAKAVEERMKSERFKTELITNVSHDLKTPLTSIVTYVDLLKKEELNNGAADEYVEILDRQSAKLKKLTEDLVEASKASSGVIAVNLTTLDAAELLQQTTAEYAEKLEKAVIEPVVNIKLKKTMINADGRLLWRVFDNLLQNICKYAMTGTRAYFDLTGENGRVTITVKNISAKPLNIPAEELMERFVRGDEARSSEGSGLGLSIANSLTELQGGHFEIMLDGDLFKAIVDFPEAGNEIQVTAND